MSPVNLKTLCCFPALFLCSGLASAAALTGQITTESGQPVMGAMLTVWNEEQLRKQTVYTNAGGNYFIVNDFEGALQVRARLTDFADSTTTVSMKKDDVVSQDFVMRHFASPQEKSDALTASAHSAQLKWEEGTGEESYVSQCHYCHQIGNSFTRAPRSETEWTDALKRMEAYFALLSSSDKSVIARTLAAGFDGQPVDAVQNYGANAELADAKVEQWLVGDAMSFIHDTDVGLEGMLYGTDEAHDVVWVLDRETHEIEQYEIPSIGLPVAG